MVMWRDLGCVVVDSISIYGLMTLTKCMVPTIALTIITYMNNGDNNDNNDNNNDNK